MSTLGPGTYKAQAIDCALATAGNGTEQIAVLFDRIDENEERTGETITWYGYFTDGAIERTVESLRYMGWTGADLMDFANGLPPTCENFVEIVVEDEKDDRTGKVRAKVKWVNQRGRGAIAVRSRMDETAAKTFSASLKKRIAGLQAAAGVTKQPAQPQRQRQPASKAAQAQGRQAAAASASRRAVENEPEGRFDDASPVDDDIPF